MTTWLWALIYSSEVEEGFCIVNVITFKNDTNRKSVPDVRTYGLASYVGNTNPSDTKAQRYILSPRGKDTYGTRRKHRENMADQD